MSTPFDIQLHYNKDPLNKISKNIGAGTLVRTVSGVLREETQVVDPDILIYYDGTLTDCNYAYISELSRYYYIMGIESVRTGLWKVTMHCDVLKTFSEGILGSQCIVSKNSKKFNLLLNDDEYKCYQNPYIFTQNFPSGFDSQTPSYILALLGTKEWQSS
jgi:hypothetical protein